MSDIITKNLDPWVSALRKKASPGRGNNREQDAYGVIKLRELILELAVRGKLLPQDPADEPANELMRRAAADKTQMTKEGRIREKDFTAIEEREIPYDVPSGWSWARIDDIGHDWGQKVPDVAFTYIDVSAIDNALGLITTPSVLSASDAPSRARKIVKRGTVIYSTVRPYLRNICVIGEDYSPEPIASTAFAVLHPFQEMPGKFFANVLRGPEFVKYVESVQTGIAYPAINDKQFYGGLVPVPPLAEQHRIVAKVDELMALCDRLEQQQTHSIGAHQSLVEALLGTLTHAESEQKLTEAWSRIADNFDTLFTTAHSIDQLKETILQLAVMGKLVPQDPRDEPASKLVGAIREELEGLSNPGNRNRRKLMSPTDGAPKPFTLPVGWEWVRMGAIGYTNIGLTYSPKDVAEDGIPVLRANNIQNGRLALFDLVHVAMKVPERALLREGDLLICARSGSRALVGKAAIVGRLEEKTAFGAFMAMFRSRVNDYLHLFVTSQVFRKVIDGVETTTINQLTQDNLRSTIVPLPPLAEQRRIVAKVDELMASCDALTARLAEAQTTQVHLADTIVEQAVT